MALASFAKPQPFQYHPRCPCAHRFLHCVPPPRRLRRLQVQCATSAPSVRRPATELLLARLMSALVQFPPLFAIMKVVAREFLKSNAEKQGINWNDRVQEMRSSSSELSELKRQVEDKSLSYPDYYLKPFHAYSEGNLNWLAAFEVESATEIIALRSFPDQKYSPSEAMDKFYGNIIDLVTEQVSCKQLKAPEQILDIGCGVGLGTRCLQSHFSTAEITGLDLSPYFLAVAMMERRHEVGPKHIRYRHGLGERTGAASQSLDLVMFEFVFHECPKRAIKAMLNEAKRILRPGGVLLVADINVMSQALRSLPLPVAIIRRSTEPWQHEFETIDLAAMVQDTGFQDVVVKETDTRHFAIVGTVGGP